MNDLKPLFGHLFADLLRGCAFWGNVQEDTLVGDVRHFLSDRLLSQFDIVSPLPAPFVRRIPYTICPLTLMVQVHWCSCCRSTAVPSWCTVTLMRLTACGNAVGIVSTCCAQPTTSLLTSGGGKCGERITCCR